MVQYGFFFDQSRCIGCQACAVACKDWNNIKPGPEKWLRIYEYEKGAFPTVRENILFIPCFHCENPVCIDASSARGIYKEEKYGAVLIDPEKATKLRDAAAACPYGAIVFESDALDAKASKCTMCIDRLEEGKMPICVEACPMRALDFGPLDQLQKKYGNLRELEDMPSGTLTKPSVVFKPKEPKRQLVPYDASKAIQLMSQRVDGLPPLYTSTSDVTEIPEGLIKRSKLLLKPSNTEELLELTKNDEA
ncbi:MAG: 4Fe-4S dicluster domain-containing protein [Nitrososphaerales archaeon]